MATTLKKKHENTDVVDSDNGSDFIPNDEPQEPESVLDGDNEATRSKKRNF